MDLPLPQSQFCAEQINTGNTLCLHRWRGRRPPNHADNVAGSPVAQGTVSGGRAGAFDNTKSFIIKASTPEQK